MLRRKTAAYALLALYDIARQHRDLTNPPGVRAGDIAERHRLPMAYVAKILSQLSGAGILHSDRGPHGGFRLNRPLDTLSLYEVFQAVGALIDAPARASLVKGLPAVVQAVIHRANQKEATTLKALFERTTIAEALQED